MHLKAKSIIYKDELDLKWHPLAEKLNQLINNVYMEKGQVNYIKKIDELTQGLIDIPLNIISVINIDKSTYQVIGGCFSPFFKINNMTADNTILLSYSTTKSYEAKGKTDDFIARIKQQIKAKFEKDIIEFIFMDFIRTISLTSLKKPGAMDIPLREITKQFGSKIWIDIFGNDENEIHQTNLAEIIGIKRDTISKQTRSVTSK